MAYLKGELFTLISKAAPSSEVALLLRDHAQCVDVEEYAQSAEESIRKYTADHHVFAFVMGGLISSSPVEDDIYRILRRSLHVATTAHNHPVFDYIVAGLSPDQHQAFSDAISDALFVAGTTLNRHAIEVLAPLSDEALGVIEALRAIEDNEAADLISIALHNKLGAASSATSTRKM